MKANELMIGDCVRHKRTKEVISIFEIDDDRNVINNEPDGYCSEKNIDIDDVEPIPLTPEILEKNGFVKAPMVSDTPPYDKDEEGNMHFSLNESFWGWWQSNNTFLIPANGLGWLEFKYLHELQHALKLCEIEKNIII